MRSCILILVISHFWNLFTYQSSLTIAEQLENKIEGQEE